MKPDLHERIAAIWGETVTAVTAPRTVDEMARRIIQDRLQLALQRGEVLPTVAAAITSIFEEMANRAPKWITTVSAQITSAQGFKKPVQCTIVNSDGMPFNAPGNPPAWESPYNSWRTGWGVGRGYVRWETKTGNFTPPIT